MGDVVGVQLLNDPLRFSEAEGDRSAVRAWEMDDAEFCDRTPDWLVDRIVGFWLTNISSYTLNTTGFGRRADLKDDAFLCSRLSSIVDEIGMGDHPHADQAALLSRLANRVLSMTSSVLGLERLPNERSLPQAIRKRFFKPVRTSTLSPSVKVALAEVVQSATFSGRGPKQESRPFVLRHNRAHYASRLMQVRVPYGEWADISPPQDPAQAVVWVKNLLEARPLLINCEVTFRGPRAHDLALLANMGSGAAAVMGARGARANQRSWVAGPEFLILTQMADVKVRGVLAADRYVPNPWAGFASASEVGPSGSGAQELVCGPLLLRGRSLVDYATGLVAECCAFALTASDALILSERGLPATTGLRCCRFAASCCTRFRPMLSGFQDSRVAVCGCEFRRETLISKKCLRVLLRSRKRVVWFRP